MAITCHGQLGELVYMDINRGKMFMAGPNL